MIQIECLGVGEACDGDNFNSSYLVSGSSNFLIDCGFAIPSRIFAKRLSPDYIDAIYLTHSHADHIFGVPALLLDLKTRPRSKPLIIIGQPGTAESVKTLTELAYSTLLTSLPFELQFLETISTITVNNIPLDFAATVHPRSNYAVRIGFPQATIGFSGDGDFTEESKSLFSTCSTVFHEAFKAETATAGHGIVTEILRQADTWPKLKQLALVHIELSERRNNLDNYLKLSSNKPYKVLIPRPGDILLDG